MASLPLDENGNMIVRIGHSPDPDDAFMFHAMTTNAFPTPGYNFVHELQDIETLNHRAMRQELEVSAVSIHAFPDIAEHYSLMNCGASMGEGYGPMIVSKQGLSLEDAKNRTLVFKQFFTRRVPIERDRYARMTKKLDNINMTNEQYRLDPTYIDKKGRDFDDFKLQNDVNLKNVVRYKETEKNLKRIYQEQKDYLKTITPEMRKLNSFEIKDNIENYKIRILKEMRQLTNHLELSDEDNRTPLFK